MTIRSTYQKAKDWMKERKEKVFILGCTAALGASLVGVINDGRNWHQEAASANQLWQNPVVNTIQYAVFDDDNNGTVDRIVYRHAPMAAPRAFMPGRRIEYKPGDNRFEYIQEQIKTGRLERAR